MNSLQPRPATQQDMAWIYDLFRRCMKTYIEQTWGWDEELQAHSFAENLPVSRWTVVEQQQEPIAAFCLEHSARNLHLAMLLVEPRLQRRGVGTQLMHQLQQLASAQRQVLRLSVLRCNPASAFYRQLGFILEAEDHERYRFCWPD